MRAPATRTRTVSRPDAVLRLADVRISVPGAHWALDVEELTLCEGETAWVAADDELHARALADAATGLHELDRGSVTVAGLDWRDLEDDQASALRGRIGRLLPPDAWVAHLSLAENILLRPAHHTDRPLAEMRAEAIALSQQFGLPGLPSGHAEAAHRSDLWPATLTRAFIDAPRLMIIEEMTNPIPRALVAPAASAAIAAVVAGAALLWISGKHRQGAPEQFARARRYMLAHGRLVTASESGGSL